MLDKIDSAYRIASVAGLAGIVVLLVVYHLLIRRRHISKEKDPRDVRRFTLLERLIHIIAALSMLTLAVTGFIAVFAGSPLRGQLWLVHYAVAPVFAVAVAIITMIWAKDGCFELYDLRWFLHLGGYLWKKEDLPAGRINAGQKKFFWIMGVLSMALILSGIGRVFPVFDATGQEILYQVHRYCALLLVMAVIAHVYLGTFANPGTIWAMISGTVSSSWAKHHHPNWWESIEGGKENEAE
ncbi:MAG: formate dehydrogenase subunit gamma [Planctomycetes bacterium]|nr:formate dehydrogenase subunit gamma [Planctomycetota bacterium]